MGPAPERVESPIQAAGTEWRHLGELEGGSPILCVKEMLYLTPTRSGDRGLHSRNLAQGWLLGLDEIVANDRGHCCRNPQEEARGFASGEKVFSEA